VDRFSFSGDKYKHNILLFMKSYEVKKMGGKLRCLLLWQSKRQRNFPPIFLTS
jgi:hypothetical protein